MKIGELFERSGLEGLKLKLGFLESEWNPQDVDRDAAWELYIELLTRITTQPLPEEDGDEQTALTSVYNLFPITREILKRQGKYCTEFAKVAIPVLNQVVRPFTAKWHRLSKTTKFTEAAVCSQFRKELRELQQQLLRYTKLLAEIAGVEDLTMIEESD